MKQKKFSNIIIDWYHNFGRKNLPWQINKSLYHVWISEIMLQQTKVSTVVPYFKKFIKRFPNLISLVNASKDEVLHLWSGLGYYKRAQNLYKTAQKIFQEHSGIFPNKFEQLILLPGIGDSTAGAILSLSKNQCFPILDGNIKRILTRYYGIYGNTEKIEIKKKLWNKISKLISKNNPKDFNQGMMDLASLICIPKNPKCKNCPLQKNCYSFINFCWEKFPTKNSKKIIKNNKYILILKYKNLIWIKKYPNSGIWGGMFSFPLFNSKQELYKWFFLYKKSNIQKINKLKTFQYKFTHCHMNITPIQIFINELGSNLDIQNGIWYNLKDKISKNKIGLTALVLNLIKKLKLNN